MFIDNNSEIDREAMRLGVLKELTQLKDRFSHLIFDEGNQSFWKTLHDCIATQLEDQLEKDKALNLETQLRNLPQYVDQWIQTSVDTTERLEFFISAKAEEIKSGDQQKDYFWAMQIRHDQLVAVVRVLSKLYNELNQWINLQPSMVVDEPVFQGLLDYSIEDQIYLEAENIQKTRAEKIKDKD